MHHGLFSVNSKLYVGIFEVVAGRGGFEPPEVLPSPVFKTGAFNRSAISRLKNAL